MTRSPMRGPPERAGLRAAAVPRSILHSFSVLAVVTAGGCAADVPNRGIRDYRPAADLPRPMTDAQQSDDVTMVVDFDAAGDTLYLLERGAELNTYVRADGRWRRGRRVAGPGGGPGEIQAASGVAIGPGGVAVNDAVRVHYFDRAGAYLRTTDLAPPCMMFQPRLAWGAAGVYLSGRCTRGGFGADTMKALLAFAADSATWQVVAEDVHYTTDGSVGSIFGPSHAFTAGSPHHLFGTAAEPCVSRVPDGGGAAVRQCGIATRMYSADPPPDVVARTKGGSVRGVAAAWPDPLPVYLDRITTPDGDVLLRPFSIDSLVLQLAGDNHRDLAVLPFESFVGCKAVGCLWVGEEEQTSLLLLTVAEIGALIWRGGGT